jgi:hypothetical protein
MPLRYLEHVPQRSRFAVWAWSPTIVLRVALLAAYLVSVYSSVWAFIAGVPVFNLTTFPGYTPVWAVLLGGSAVLSAIGSITDRWQQLEKWSSLALSALWLAYVGGLTGVGFAQGDPDRQFLAAASITLLVLPVARFVYLAAQSGKKKYVHGDR